MSLRHVALPLSCPKCQYGEAHLYVLSETILTVQCAACHHPWSLKVAVLPEHAHRVLQQQVGSLERWRERRR